MRTHISIIDHLDFTKGIEEVQLSEPASALKRHYINEVKGFGIDKIYFSGEFPSVYFKKTDSFDKNTQQEILNIRVFKC